MCEALDAVYGGVNSGIRASATVSPLASAARHATPLVGTPDSGKTMTSLDCRATWREGCGVQFHGAEGFYIGEGDEDDMEVVAVGCGV